MRKKIVAGNWKMNLNRNEAIDLYNELKNNSNKINKNVKVIIAPPTIYLSEFSKNTNNKIELAAQNCNENENGAFTGEISASMLKSIGVKYCIVGHSERREYYKETNNLLKSKIDTLISHKITPIYCFGESYKDREENKYFNTVETQISEALFHLSDKEISSVVLAYEPVWAIGTGITATPKQAQEIHRFVRELLTKKYNKKIASNISIIYGGSCKPTNAVDIFSNADVDGGLIGGASLKTDSFISVINSN